MLRSIPSDTAVFAYDDQRVKKWTDKIVEQWIGVNFETGWAQKEYQRLEGRAKEGLVEYDEYGIVPWGG